MTTAHRPTWDPAKAKDDSRSTIIHERALPSHTLLKTRQDLPPTAQLSQREREYKLLAAEALHDAERGIKRQKSKVKYIEAMGSAKDSCDSSEAGEIRTGDTREGDESDADQSLAQNAGTLMAEDLSASEDEDDEDELRAELDQLRARADESQKSNGTMERAFSASTAVPAKRSWRAEAVFNNRAASKPRQGHVNDSLHSTGHKEFMKKYVRS